MKELIKNYADETKEELIEIITKLCSIASFSHNELNRAKYIKDWFKQYNIEADIDEKYNVSVWINKSEVKDMVIFSAHIDTVFPDTVGFEVVKDGNHLCAPGVGDDTTNVAEMMLIVRYLHQHNYTSDYSLLFVFNSCEEGLGNLEGSKYIVNQYASRLKEYYSLDLCYTSIINKAVGSTRYRIKIKTEGGHSYSAFGNTNAIAVASALINELYQYQVPTASHSTYNVGIIEGGTSVNTIAQDVSFLFEYRSDSQKDLSMMMNDFDNTIKRYQEKYNIEVEVIGVRPSMGDVDETKLAKISKDVLDNIKEYTGLDVPIHSGSTDCNIALSLGIPAVCFGGYIGYGEHTRQEYVEIDSLYTGIQIAMRYIMKYTHK